MDPQVFTFALSVLLSPSYAHIHRGVNWDSSTLLNQDLTIVAFVVPNPHHHNIHLHPYHLSPVNTFS